MFLPDHGVRLDYRVRRHNCQPADQALPSLINKITGDTNNISQQLGWRQFGNQAIRKPDNHTQSTSSCLVRDGHWSEDKHRKGRKFIIICIMLFYTGPVQKEIIESLEIWISASNLRSKLFWLDQILHMSEDQSFLLWSRLDADGIQHEGVQAKVAWHDGSELSAIWYNCCLSVGVIN